MKRAFALALVFMLLFSTAAWAGEDENAIASPVENEEEVTSEETFTFSLFGYSIVVVPGTSDSPASVGFFATDDTGQPQEELSTFTVGSILGKAVSTVARVVPGGPSHGKVVREFVRQAVKHRKLAQKQNLERKKAKIRARVKAKRDKIGDKAQDKKETIKERKAERKGILDAKKQKLETTHKKLKKGPKDHLGKKEQNQTNPTKINEP